MIRLTALLVLTVTPALAEGDIVAAGRQVYTTSCEPCHGPTATEGEVGDIRGLSLGTVTGAVQGFEMMPRIPLSPAEIEAVVAYLAALARS